MKIAIYKEKETFDKLKADGGVFDRLISADKQRLLKGKKRRMGDSNLLEIYTFDGVGVDCESLANVRPAFMLVLVFEVKDFQLY